MIVDTHTHPYLPEFDADRDAVMTRAADAGVDLMILPNVNATTIAPMKALHSAYPQSTAMAIGIHPTELGADIAAALATVESELKSDTRYVAVGEIGLDLHWDKENLASQLEAFDAQLDMACTAGLPAIIHCRDAWEQMLDLLRSRRNRLPRLVLHSFGGTADDVDQVRRITDPMFGINGIVTFKNSQLRTVLPKIGTDRLLLETDAPYLAPVPLRGKRCEPALITHTARHAAESLDIAYDRFCELTSHNARDFFMRL